ncbi:ankyrin repeat domain-containing protein [Candidatus Dependentiae bacterium]|nr:ankyrin repeat domain-containing protein [Candidatus Dependentiae bacterium]
MKKLLLIIPFFSCLYGMNNLDSQLIDAAHNGNAQQVQKLLTLGANPHVTTFVGWTPLELAKSARAAGRAVNDKAIQILEEYIKLEHAADANPTKELLDKALEQGYAPIAKKLLSKLQLTVADLTSYNKLLQQLYRQTNYLNIQLFQAAQNGNTQQVQELLAAGANPNAADENHYTPLHNAAYSANSEAIKALLAAGANPNVKDDKGYTPLQSAEQFNSGHQLAQVLNQEEIIKLLRNYNELDLTADAQPTKELLDKAIGLGYLFIVKKLLPKLQLTAQEIAHYNQRLQSLYQQTNKLVYKYMGQEFKQYALRFALARRSAQEMYKSASAAQLSKKRPADDDVVITDIQLPKELASYIATYAQGQ